MHKHFLFIFLLITGLRWHPGKLIHSRHLHYVLSSLLCYYFLPFNFALAYLLFSLFMELETVKKATPKNLIDQLQKTLETPVKSFETILMFSESLRKSLNAVVWEALKITIKITLYPIRVVKQPFPIINAVKGVIHQTSIFRDVFPRYLR